MFYLSRSSILCDVVLFIQLVSRQRFTHILINKRPYYYNKSYYVHGFESDFNARNKMMNRNLNNLRDNIYSKNNR